MVHKEVTTEVFPYPGLDSASQDPTVGGGRSSDGTGTSSFVNSRRRA